MIGRRVACIITIVAIIGRGFLLGIAAGIAISASRDRIPSRIAIRIVVRGHITIGRTIRQVIRVRIGRVAGVATAIRIAFRLIVAAGQVAARHVDDIAIGHEQRTQVRADVAIRRTIGQVVGLRVGGVIVAAVVRIGFVFAVTIRHLATGLL